MRLFIMRSSSTGRWQVHSIITTTKVEVGTLASYSTREEALAFRRGHITASLYHNLTNEFLIASLGEETFTNSKGTSGGACCKNPT